ncbi:MAG: 1-acyl-sn-glycerol-3-phosphate acyltransferase [Candidatus Omnitrophica bacterium]|nr:1-acyl-sn-glycerol-3-phosphate acyltransferase [Candidatus Omnitrophota bacterium]
MKSTDFSANVATGFRPAKHSRWVIWAIQLWNAIGLAWHNRLRLDSRDLEILETIPKDSGLILAANHSDEMDPRICIELSRSSHRRFTYMINAEAFEEWHGLYGWLLQRLGDFSVERSGSDQTARRYAVDVVKKGHDTLVMFPEGEISYLNDLVQPFKTGAVHIGLQAITENRKINPSWTAYLLPVAIKYHYRKPISLILNKRIRALEKRLLIRASSLTLQEKIIRIMATILKRQELISRTQGISEQLALLEEQIREAQTAILSKIETKYPQLQIGPKTQLIDRAQKIISFLREQLRRKKLFSSETKIQLQEDINELKQTIQMAAWQPQYIDLAPSEERLAETVMKLEREVFKLKKPRPLGKRDCLVRIGRPLDLGPYVEPYQKNPSTLSHQITEELRKDIQILIIFGPRFQPIEKMK